MIVDDERERISRAYQDMADQMQRAFYADGTFSPAPSCPGATHQTQGAIHMVKFSTTDTSRIIGEQVKRIHASIHDGTLDKATIDHALGELSNLAAGVNEVAPANPHYGTDSTGQSVAPAVPHRGENPANPNDPNPDHPGRSRVDNHANPARGRNPA